MRNLGRNTAMVLVLTLFTGLAVFAAVQLGWPAVRGVGCERPVRLGSGGRVSGLRFRRRLERRWPDRFLWLRRFEWLRELDRRHHDLSRHRLQRLELPRAAVIAQAIRMMPTSSKTMSEA